MSIHRLLLLMRFHVHFNMLKMEDEELSLTIEYKNKIIIKRT